jgi:osmotically-inducible protein OsmY
LDHIRDKIGRFLEVPYNHVRIVTKEAEAQKGEKQENGELAQKASDTWINAKIKVLLIAAAGVKSVNYRWQSVLNRVYVIGLARTSLEKDRVLQIIRETKGVNSVNDYIEVLRGN